MRTSETLCFSGHRTGRLPERDRLEELKRQIFAAVDEAIAQGYRTFLFGACYGFDLIAAQQVILRKKLQKGNRADEIRLVAVIPFEEQANSWKESNREEYFNVLAHCDDCIVLSPDYREGCWMDRNRFMINHSSRLICYYGGGAGLTGYTVFYARAKGVEIKNLC